MQCIIVYWAMFTAVSKYTNVVHYRSFSKGYHLFSWVLTHNGRINDSDWLISRHCVSGAYKKKSSFFARLPLLAGVNDFRSWNLQTGISFPGWGDWSIASQDFSTALEKSKSGYLWREKCVDTQECARRIWLDYALITTEQCQSTARKDCIDFTLFSSTLARFL